MELNGYGSVLPGTVVRDGYGTVPVYEVGRHGYKPGWDWKDTVQIQDERVRNECRTEWVTGR